jgi:hypothetical protein
MPSFMRIALLLLLLFCASLVRATPSAPALSVVAMRLVPGEHIAIDGSLDHPAWQRAPVFNEFMEAEPTRGATPRFETRVQVLVDHGALYVGVTALDPHPEQIRQQLVRHDQVRRTQDFVALYLDPIGRKKSAQWFRVAASGSTADGMHTAEDDAEDFLPDFEFEAASRLTDNGYTAVFRVPFSTLRYHASAQGSERLPWRMMVVRRVPRDQIYLLMSVPLARDAASFIDALQVLEGVDAPQNDNFLQLRPNLTLRQTGEHGPDSADTTRSNARLGLELKWRPRPELVVDGTWKPDFSQVELDVPQLSKNTQFALFLPEKRPFFLESSDLLRSPNYALYTRAVTRPDWGLRATWRSESLAATAFATHDLGGGSVLIPGPYGTGFAPQPDSDNVMARWRTDQADLTLGGVAALRRYHLADGTGRAGDNLVVGPDVTWQATPNLRLRGQWLLAQTSAWPGADGTLKDAAPQRGGQWLANAFWRAEPYETGLNLESSDRQFRNDSGFVAQTGVQRVFWDAHRIWRAVGPLNEVWLNLFAENIRDRESGATVYSQVTPSIYTNYSNNSEFALEYRGLSRQRVSAQHSLLQEHYWHLLYTRTLARWAPTVSVELDHGSLADVSAVAVRPGQRVTLSATLRPMARLELLPMWSLAQIDAPVGSGSYRESAAQVLAIWHLAPQQTLRAIVQRRSATRVAEPALGVAGYHDRSQADSLTYAWRRSAGSTLYVGANRSTAGAGAAQTRGTELFVKMQFDVDGRVATGARGNAIN